MSRAKGRSIYTKMLQIRVDTDTMQDIKHEAARRSWPDSEVVRRALEVGLREIKKGRPNA